MRRIAIIGAGLAGVRAAETLRREGFDGDLAIVGDELEEPYDRPPLSKDFLLGAVGPADLRLCDDTVRSVIGATWMAGREAVGLAGHGVRLDGGEELPADGIVIATGARPRNLSACRLDGVHVLRTLDDAFALRERLTPGARLLIAGAGFIGAEVASTAVALGVQVVVVEVLERPFAARLGSDAAAVLCRRMRAHGVRLRPGVGVASVKKHGGTLRVELIDGTKLVADVMLTAVGSVPNTEWLAGSGVECYKGGVLTDRWGRTSMAGVVAAGDVANVRRPAGGRRVEHWTNARDAPVVAARTLLADHAGADPPAAYDDPPYFWSEQFGMRVQAVGRIHPRQPIHVVEGDLADDRFVAVQRVDDRVTAVLGFSMPREFTRLRRAHKETLASWL